MTQLLPHQQRVIEEHAELSERCEKLKAFQDTEIFSKLPLDEANLLIDQLAHMLGYQHVLEQRIKGFHGIKRYRCHKAVEARPMTRQAYNDLRGWTLPENEDGADEGYLVEYQDGGAANHPDFKGYISWSPKEVFERGYKESA